MSNDNDMKIIKNIGDTNVSEKTVTCDNRPNTRDQLDESIKTDNTNKKLKILDSIGLKCKSWFNKTDESIKTDNTNKTLKILDSILLNYKSWLLTFFAIFIISRSSNLAFGYYSYFAIMLLAYSLHASTHDYNNILTSTHTYHHKHHNLFSHIIQVCLEIACAGSVLLIYNFTGYTLFDPWITIFSNIFYTTVHNINYAIFKVNNVHSLHHVYEHTNMGPDIFDVMFGTKNKHDKSVENTKHYIPNIIVALTTVMILKYFWNKEENRSWMYKFATLFVYLVMAIVAVSSVVIWTKDLNATSPQ